MPLPLDEPCRAFELGLRCSEVEGYIEINPFGSSFHYKHSCSRGHYVRNVPRAEVELRLGISHTVAKKDRHPLEPSRRTSLNVIIRDGNACVYCGRKVGDVDLAGNPVLITADHIIPKDAIDPQDIRYDRDMFSFARDIQLVAACQSHNAAKGATLIDYEAAERIFIQHVLRNNVRGKNLGAVATFKRLYRLTERTMANRNRLRR